MNTYTFIQNSLESKVFRKLLLKNGVIKNLVEISYTEFFRAKHNLKLILQIFKILKNLTFYTLTLPKLIYSNEIANFFIDLFHK